MSFSSLPALVKWVRRGKFQKALAKLRHSKDKTKEAKAEAVSETDEETSLSAALTDDVDVLEDPYPEASYDSSAKLCTFMYLYK